MSNSRLKLLLLHALPLDGSMWKGQMHLLPGSTHAPTLYSLGDSIDAWAVEALRSVRGTRLIVVGCSVGGSCALEIAALAPERIAALVLIGTKARHRPDPTLHVSVLELLQAKGLAAAWDTYWASLFSESASSQVIDAAKAIAFRQPLQDVARGVTVFHTRPSREHVVLSLPRPIVIVTGEDDRAPGPEASSMQTAQARHGRLTIVRNCGHYVPLEQPEYLNAVLQELISEQQRSSPEQHLR
ncbi:alpha/beta fold hydrolase [Sinorhizobium psoraleae]|uniref:alpha/beta fold hydrolase n=1 Tax=Sinorhizobium psoraleae TaxID=520838 RepID=UPI00156868F3|nr:alpha/beta hydrolase [Sinorhizobium psoraleae]